MCQNDALFHDRVISEECEFIDFVIGSSIQVHFHLYMKTNYLDGSNNVESHINVLCLYIHNYTCQSSILRHLYAYILILY